MLNNRLRVFDDWGITSQTILLFSMLLFAALLVGRAAPLPPLEARPDRGVPAEAQSQIVAPGELPAGLSSSEWNSIQGAIHADQYHWSTEGKTTNPAQGWDVRFDQNGMLVAPLDDDNWQWGLKLTGYGYENRDFQSLQDFGSLATDQNTLTYSWDQNISEWWVNTPAGLEQGFTLQERPPASGATKQTTLVVEMAVTGTLTPFQVGETIHFQNAAGETILTYDKLLVTDAGGNIIPAQLHIHPSASNIQILVEDQNAVYPLIIDPWTQSAKLTTSNTAEDPAFFGYSVSIRGDTIVVGAVGSSSTGAAYIFEKPTTGWANMTPTAKLTASDEAANDYFGFDVAISGDTVVVGARLDDDDGDNSGSAYIFEKPTIGWTDMNETAKLTAKDAAAHDNFGTGVAIDGDTVVIGAEGDDDNGDTSGSVYIFEKGAGWNDGFSNQVAKLTASDGDAWDRLGKSVDIEGDTVVAGAKDHDVHGAVYVFEKPGTSWVDGTETAKLTANDRAADDDFGISVAISGDVIVAGARYDDDNGDNSGSAYAFEKDTGWISGSSNQVAKLTASNGTQNDEFGYAVAIDGDVILVGAWNAANGDGDDAGSVYTFEKPASGWADMTETDQHNSSDGATGDYFGETLSIDGQTFVAGAHKNNVTRGAAYVFEFESPDLDVDKSNDTSDQGVVDTPFDWMINVANVGNQDATFTDGQTIFQDDLPTSGASYGSPTAQNLTDIINGDDLDCTIVGTTLTCMADDSNVTIEADTGSFDVVFSVTPDTAGSLVNPDGSGVCQVDPDDQISEDDESNNDCTDTVTVLDKPDLQVAKANDTGGTGIVGTAFNWTVTISNTGGSDAAFANGQTMFRDDLPSTGVSYGTPSAQNFTDTTNSGSIDCNIVGMVLTCTANGSNVILGATTGKFEVVFSVTPDTAGSLVNPDGSGVCQVDPDDQISEDDETNNDCTDTVTVLDKPDLQVAKANDTGGTGIVGTAFNWTVTISNTGGSDAAFANGQTMFRDDLPSTGVSYGTPSAQNFTDTTNSGSIDCNIVGMVLTCTANGSNVILGATTGKFEVVFSVTPDTAGSLVNPDGSGVCQVDPDDQISEDDESNNDCTDTVTVLDKPDLQVAKANDTGGTGIVGTAFNWTVTISNTGGSDAAFANGQTMFRDDLPSTGVSYGTPSAQNFTDTTNSGSIDCNIVGMVLTCTANGSNVILGATTGKFEVVFSVTPDTAGSLVNPDGSGVCQVDPDDQISEDDETNNDCTDTVTVLDKPDLEISKANDTSGSGFVGTMFTWTATLSNTGGSDATFMDGQTIFQDDLPASGAAYGLATAQNFTDITNSGNVDCNIVGTALTCMANGADVTFGAAMGSFEVAFEVTPTVEGSLTNPDPNGICQIDPDDHVDEDDESDNQCGDTVTVVAAKGDDGEGDDDGDEDGGGRPSRNCPVGVPGGICRLRNLVKVTVFANTVSDGSSILIQEKASGQFHLGDRVFDVTIIGPDGGAINTFEPPIEVCLRPTNAELKAAGWIYGNLSLFHRHAGGPWEAIYNTYEKDGKVCAKMWQLSEFAIGVSPLPDTGFAPGVEHALPEQPAEKAYAAYDRFRLEIPSLGVKLPIVGVPMTEDGWDVRWLGAQAGWLYGTAFPTWAGNTALTAHVWDADNNPGPFVDLETLQHGDEIIIHAWGLTHTYEVRGVEQVRPDDLRALPHEDYDVLTLLTCRGFDEASNQYDWRLAVRAVLMNVEAE